LNPAEDDLLGRDWGRGKGKREERGTRLLSVVVGLAVFVICQNGKQLKLDQAPIDL